MKPDNCQLPLCWVRDLVPGLIAPGLEGGRRARVCDTLHMFMMGASRMANIADFGNLTPTHPGSLGVQVYNELADLLWQGIAGISCPTLRACGEEALHSVLFKLSSFAGQRAAGDIDLFLSLPWGFMEEDQGAYRFVKFLLWPQRPLFYLSPLVGALAAGSVE